MSGGIAKTVDTKKKKMLGKRCGTKQRRSKDISVMRKTISQINCEIVETEERGNKYKEAGNSSSTKKKKASE